MSLIDLGPGVQLDPIALATSRGLIQASSGGGKSVLLRLIVEHAADAMPVFVIDPEGEFYTIRERAGMVLIGANGEIPCKPETAAKVARALLEESTSAIVDLSELPAARHDEYVGEFIRGAMHAPRSCWRPTLFAIDEAHRYCAEKAAAGHAAAQVIDLMSRGRKRGFGGVLLTQRISKLRKDAVAEAANVWIGRTNLDLDTKRAADSLGMSARDAAQILPGLRPGEWFAYGPALQHHGVAKFLAHMPETRAPEGPGVAVPPTRHAAALAAVAAKVATAETDGRPATLEDAEREISRLHAQVAQLTTRPADPQTADATRSLRKTIEALTERAIAAETSADKRESAIAEIGAHAAHARELCERAGKDLVATVERLRAAVDAAAVALEPMVGPPDATDPQETTAEPATPPQEPRSACGNPRELRRSGNAADRVLWALAWWSSIGNGSPTTVQLAIVADLSPKSSTIRAARADLKAGGLIEYRGDRTALTHAGRAKAPQVHRPTLAEWHDRVRDQLGNGVARRVFDALLASGGSRAVEPLCIELDLSPQSSTIRAGLAKLRQLGLVAKGNPVALTPLAYPEGIA